MSVEQIARDFIQNMTDEKKTTDRLTPNAMVDGGVLPKPMPAKDAIKLMQGLSTAMPDLTFDIQEVDVNGNLATVKAIWRGTQTGPLDLGIPGVPVLPPTRKKVSVEDTYLVVVKGDKVDHLTVESPANGGIPGALSQLGVDNPGMPSM
jgi:hypothetical protein